MFGRRLAVARQVTASNGLSRAVGRDRRRANLALPYAAQILDALRGFEGGEVSWPHLIPCASPAPDNGQGTGLMIIPGASRCGSANAGAGPFARLVELTAARPVQRRHGQRNLAARARDPSPLR